MVTQHSRQILKLSIKLKFVKYKIYIIFLIFHAIVFTHEHHINTFNNELTERKYRQQQKSKQNLVRFTNKIKQEIDDLQRNDYSTN